MKPQSPYCKFCGVKKVQKKYPNGDLEYKLRMLERVSCLRDECLAKARCRKGVVVSRGYEERPRPAHEIYIDYFNYRPLL